MHHKPWIVRVPREPRSNQGPRWVNGAHALGAKFSEHQAERLPSGQGLAAAREAPLLEFCLMNTLTWTRS